jgi:hypothetical protein
MQRWRAWERERPQSALLLGRGPPPRRAQLAPCHDRCASLLHHTPTLSAASHRTTVSSTPSCTRITRRCVPYLARQRARLLGRASQLLRAARTTRSARRVSDARSPPPTDPDLLAPATARLQGHGIEKRRASKTRGKGKATAAALGISPPHAARTRARVRRGHRLLERGGARARRAGPRGEAGQRHE